MTGEKIYLRALEPADIDKLYEWENDPAIWHLGNTAEPFSYFTLEQYILDAGRDIFTTRQLRLIIVKRDDDHAVGSIDLFDFDPLNHRAGIGILIDRKHRQKGFAAEALALIMEYSFSTLSLHQLFCNIGADNTPSIRLFQNAGFVICGTKKEWTRNAGKYNDEHILQFIKH
jgi:diamine N-acetyltransferase